VPRLLVTMLSLLFFMSGCTGSGSLLSGSERGTVAMSAFDFGETPAMLTLQQEVGQLLAPPILVLSRTHDGTVQIQNSAGRVDTISFHAPLLAFFSCPLRPTLPFLSLR
jgi:hypothetical protein